MRDGGGGSSAFRLIYNKFKCPFDSAILRFDFLDTFLNVYQNTATSRFDAACLCDQTWK